MPPRPSPTISPIPTRHKITKMRVTDLTPWDDNPRRIDDAAFDGLAISVSRFGLVQPIIFNERTSRVVGGHQRLKVLIAHGIEQTDVVVVDLPEAEERALNLALNNRHITGEWTENARDLLGELAGGFDAFKDLKLDTLLDELGRTNLRDGIDAGLTDEDEAVEPPTTPITRPGDLWRLDPHRILCGDSTEPATLQRLLEGRAADGLFCDPPYHVAYDPSERSARTGKRKRTTDPARGPIANDDLPPEKFRRFLKAAFESSDSVLKPGGPIHICAPAGWDLHHFFDAWPEKSWHYQALLVWAKGQSTLSRWDYRPAHEQILYGWKKGAKRTWLGGRKQSTVIEVTMGSGRGYVHPTQKPVKLIRGALTNAIPEGDLVLDPFGGSGSTLIAAETCGRRAYLCEIDPRFVDAAVKRWESYTGEKAEREEAGR